MIREVLGGYNQIISRLYQDESYIIGPICVGSSDEV